MAPEALLLRHPQKPIEEFNAFQRGWFQVQDEAAQLVTILLDPQPGKGFWMPAPVWAVKPATLPSACKTAAL